MSIPTNENVKPRKKLTFKEQIQDLKSKGISFTIIDEERAESFLLKNNYYFKLKAYAKNYEKKKRGSNEIEYCNLEFAYLVELSTLDMYLRSLIFKFCLDLEHYLKLQIVRDCTNNPEDDGYEIIQDLFARYPELEDAAKNVNYSSYSNDLFFAYSDKYALWNVIELLQFGDFSKLYSFYYKRFPDLPGACVEQYIFNVRNLRNAAAHNNCIINDLTSDDDFEPNKAAYSAISEIPGISAKTLSNNMTNQRVHDFVIMLLLYDKIVTSTNRKIRMLGELKDFFENRMVLNRRYFLSNGMIQSRYHFVHKVLEYFYKKAEEENQQK